ncbi:peptidase S9A prolyl oligopeptidase domain protein beta-propeller [Rhizoclosmatium globosum]|uniref:Prolyl endopeptidase n=1 Tax=Rhizoclosmatium globosum TaxID=329046 RepID=A0A1Y2D2U9_9FUNG|nr:peptidase S9A prolyl oligopeptidase domain protein beta-propeller [Rhizoclosmatium globosum]|eukprot:ORY52895.1 peptidase S9A prolyl oligopeptidase domain protein beta-propeller [Rhizoclosmatium globosum]
MTSVPVPPVAKREPTIHAYNSGVPDDYHWLKDTTKGSKKDDVLEYVKAENEYTKAVEFTPNAELSETIYKEIVGRIQETDQQVPYFKNGFWYYTRTVEGQQYPIYCRRCESMEADEEIYFNPNDMKEEYIRVGTLAVSKSGKLLAYSLDTDGSEAYKISVKNLETGEILADTLSKCSPSIVWDTEDKAFYYQSQDDLFRADKLYKHVLGSDPKDDEMLHHNDDEKFFAFIGKSGSERFLILRMSSPQTTEFHYLDLETPGATLKCFTPRQHGHRYSIDHRGDYFLILTDGGGPFLNGKVQKVGINDTSRELWQDVLPYNPYHEIRDVSCFADFIVLQERVDGNNRIRVIESLDNPESSYLIPFDAEFFAAYLSRSSVQDFNSDRFRLTFYSPLTPTKTLDYNVKTKEFTLLKQQKVPSGFDASEYTLRRVHVPIPEELRVKAPHDTPVAEAVPVTLVYKTALFKSDNTNKVHLYGYGSYGIPIDPYFSPAFPSLIDRGIVYAIAHIRGGGDLGRGWYETGKFLNKKNTFYDFVNSAKYLVEQGITQHQLITLEGGSAGGLLIGASLNLKPDVAVAAIASVPFVDVINTMMDPTLPLTVAEYEEWGNPNEKEYFDYMLSYSPYDNIKANTKYPSILAKGGLFDPRVGYWEPAKWIAKLRASNTNGAEDDPHKSTFIFDCKMGSGHFGSSGRYARFKEMASEYAFIVTQLEASEKRLAAAARKWNKTTTTTTTTVTIGGVTTSTKTAVNTVFTRIN